MGTTQSAISRLESGSATPSIEAIERYAQAVGQPISLTFGTDSARPMSRSRRRKRVRDALGDFRFDPWARQPSQAEARTLIADQLIRGKR